MTKTVTVKTPATTANLGPGFDCIGAALTLYNTFSFTAGSDNSYLDIKVTGAEETQVSCNADNLVYQSFVRLYEHLGRAVPSVSISIEMAVPLARGLGSSATAIVGGLMGANGLAGNPCSEAEVMELAIAIEGHPDNVVPALLGGCRLAVSREQGWLTSDIPWNPSIIPVIAIPNFELSTAEARQVLPLDYTRHDAIFNTSHMGLLVRALETGNPDWLQTALHDRIHQPYRKTLIRGYDRVEQAAINAGAFGMTISGAGPTLIALAAASQAPDVATAMARAWQTEGVEANVRSLSIDSQGATVTLS
ncbi:homoserine kinase [Roseofilum casamattae]|uniref:Homoserine kinase n=1 Tax=Roseofilum casamattae BLCC-M143 TaxID=3022442 RepID=A0ABT7BYZ7_9CYAN|nr:homoserine kinase [Roseofilum casamattae]MDJ1184295.1 homoserine kinase [Roseofilum casamattae BLCC-M143]